MVWSNNNNRHFLCCKNICVVISYIYNLFLLSSLIQKLCDLQYKDRISFKKSSLGIVKTGNDINFIYNLILNTYIWSNTS